MDIIEKSNFQPELKKKWAILLKNLSLMEKFVVAYSGGVDSTLLLKAATMALGENALGVLVSSPLNPAKEKDEAVAVARQMGARLIVVEMNELEEAAVIANPIDRCYHCKRLRFSALMKMAKEMGISHVLEGSNVDDTGDYRPGMKAVEELGVESPLLSAGLTKADIRAISRELGLPTWNKLSASCLATRFPYGQQLSPEKMKMVEAAEEFLKGKGFSPLRVRVHGEAARIEVSPEKIPMIMERDLAGEIVRRFKEIGFLFVSADLEGYESGSMNRGIPQNK